MKRKLECEILRVYELFKRKLFIRNKLYYRCGYYTWTSDRLRSQRQNLEQKIVQAINVHVYERLTGWSPFVNVMVGAGRKVLGTHKRCDHKCICKYHNT